MWILSEDLKSLFNTNNIVDIYITPSGDAIKVALSGHMDLTLGEYGCREETGFVFSQILAALTDGCKLHRMPPKEQISRRFVTESRQRAANGKKTVRRGGS